MMNTTLLIIKVKEDYIRIKGEEYELCSLEKASVFPMPRLEEVRTHAQKVKELFQNAGIHTLELIERPLEEV